MSEYEVIVDMKQMGEKTWTFKKNGPFGIAEYRISETLLNMYTYMCIYMKSWKDR
jgi:hypothetical protein